MRISRGIAVVALACGLLAATASATTVTATFNSSYGRNVSVYYTPDSGSPVNESTTAGEYIWTRTGGDDTEYVPTTGQFSTACIDVEGTIYYGNSYTWNVLAGKDAIVGYAPTRMPPGGAIQEVQYDRLLKLYVKFYKPTATWSQDEAAAFGSAVWEIVWESPVGDIPTSYDVDAGLLAVTGNTTVTGRAQEMLDWVTTDTGTAYGTLVALVNTPGQDQMIAFGFGYEPPIPEPLTLLAVGSAVMGLAGYVRRRRLAQA